MKQSSFSYTQYITITRTIQGILEMSQAKKTFVWFITRFIAVLRPFEYNTVATRGRCIWAIVLMWLCSIGVAVLPVSGWRCDFSCDGFPSTGCSQLYPGISRGYLIFYVSLISKIIFTTFKHEKYNLSN